MGSWDWDLETGLITWDETTAGLFGMELDVLDGQIETFFEALHPDDRPVVQRAIEQALEECGEYRIEFRVVRAGGPQRWLQARGRVVLDDSGMPARLAGVVIDSTELRSARARVARTLEHISDSFFALDNQWRFTYVNPAAERVLDRRADELLGRVMWEEFPETANSAFWDEYHRAMAEQRATAFEEFYPPLGVWLEVRAFPAPDGLSVYFRDMTERRAAEQERASLFAAERAARAEAEAARARLLFLTQTSALVAGSLDQEEIVSRLARATVPALADWCAVYLPVGDRLVRVALAHADPPAQEPEIDQPLSQHDATTFSVEDDCPVSRSYRTCEGQLWTPALDGVVHPAVGDAEVSENVRALGIRSLMTVPVCTGGRSLGVLTFGVGASRRPFVDDDLALAEELARRAAMAMVNAATYQREHSLALSLQRAILPDRLPACPGMALAARYDPASAGSEVGGDWYDAFSLPHGRLALVLGDVAGHGVGAASLMGQLRNAVRAYALEGHPPSEVLRRLDHFLTTLHPDALATVVYVDVDPATGNTCWASAGHPSPLLIERGTAHFVESPGGVALGSGVAVRFPEAGTTLPAAAALLLYSDGLVERRGESLDDRLELLRNVVARLGPAGTIEHCDRLFAALLGGSSHDDDVCVLSALRQG
jgi:PAS domain S-box-containing protein